MRRLKRDQVDTVIELREDYQYGVRKEVGDKNSLKKLIALCTDLMNLTKTELYEK
jgi:hypothetical protein